MELFQRLNEAVGDHDEPPVGDRVQMPRPDWSAYRLEPSPWGETDEDEN